MKRLLLGTALVLWNLVGTTVAFPCTTFVLKGEGRIYFGRNLDWDWEDGLVIVNPRYLRKTAFVSSDRPVMKWTSKYGSVTFNQFGREMPMGGMNEAGLVIENMWLEDTRYPAPDDRPEIGLLQWIQYQLDTCRIVADVIATDHHVRLKQHNNPVKVHYFTCDATGDCATIEFLDGKMVQHRGQNLPFKALANSTYSQSVTFTQANPESGNGTGRLQNPTSLLRRFFYSSRELASSHPRHCASVPLDLRPRPDRLS